MILDLFFSKTFHILSFSVNGGPKYGQTSPHIPKYLISMQKSKEMSKKNYEIVLHLMHGAPPPPLMAHCELLTELIKNLIIHGFISTFPTIPVSPPLSH